MKKITVSAIIITLTILSSFAAPKNSIAAEKYYYNGQYISKQQLRVVLIAQIKTLLASMNVSSTSNSVTVPPGIADVSVQTLNAELMTDSEAVLVGKLWFKDLTERKVAYAWFEYGINQNNLSKQTEKIRIGVNDNSNLYSEIDGLEEGFDYYYRAVSEDSYGRRDFGQTVSFTTNGADKWLNSKRKPVVITDEVHIYNYNEKYDSTQRYLSGRIDVNGNTGGQAFFAFGEDKDWVETFANRYKRIDDFSDNSLPGWDRYVAKFYDLPVGSALEEYQTGIGSLEKDVDYYFSMCLQYKDKNNSDTIMCGETENFEIDA